jgi:hypothetical protein
MNSSVVGKLSIECPTDRSLVVAAHGKETVSTRPTSGKIMIGWQNLLVIVLLTVAAGLLARHLWRLARGRGGCAGCCKLSPKPFDQSEGNEE